MRTKRKYFPTLHTTFEPWRPKCEIHGMGVLEITPEQRVALGDVCLGIFADMTNAGAPLQEILAACYMSGVQHTLSTLAPNDPHERAAEGGPLDAVVSGNSRIITMIDITSLSVGDKVYYQPGHYGDREYENGIVKEIREGMDDAVWVVYHCAGEWDRYREFTSAKTNLRDLKLGWKP